MKRTFLALSMIAIGFQSIGRSMGLGSGELRGVSLPAAPAGAQGLRLQYENTERKASTKSPALRVRLINDGDESLDLSEITLRYWLASEPQEDNLFVCDWAQVGKASVHGTFIETPSGLCLEIGFEPDALVASWLGGDGVPNRLPPGAETGGVHVRFHTSSWSYYDQSNHYSWDPSFNQYADYERITVYYQGTRVWGQPPAVAEETYEQWAAGVFSPEQLADPSVSGPHADPDGDGMTNDEERLAGTDPLDAASVLAINDLQSVSQDEIAMQWPSVAGREYTVWSAPSPHGPFTPVRTGIAAAPPFNRTQMNKPADQARQLFFRVSVSRPNKPAPPSPTTSLEDQEEAGDV